MVFNCVDAFKQRVYLHRDRESVVSEGLEAKATGLLSSLPHGDQVP